MDTKTRPCICYLQETHFRPRYTYRLKWRGWKNIFHANGNQKKAGVTILISDKINFKIKTDTRDKEGLFVTTFLLICECWGRVVAIMSIVGYGIVEKHRF